MGKTHSEETRAKLSKAGIGRTVSEETRAKISKANLGKHRSAETKEKMSKAWETRPGISAETRAKMSKATKGHTRNLGRTHSEETRAKMSKATKGKKWVKNIELNRCSLIHPDELDEYFEKGYILGKILKQMKVD